MPCFNEANVIVRKTIAGLIGLGYNVVAVDDGSTNGMDLSGLDVYVLKHQINLGQGAAIQTGIDFSVLKGGEYFVTFDADGQHNADEIKGMIDLLKTNKCDIVFGSRFLPSAFTNISTIKKIIIQLARFINFCLTGILLSDAHNGFRALNLNAAQKIQLKENRMAHASEYLLEVKRKQLKFNEYPVTIKYTDYSIKKGQKVSNSVQIIFDLIIAKIFE